MLFTLLGTLIALACVLASARRLWLAARATAVDPSVLLEALGGARGAALWPELRAELTAAPAAEWERDLLEALRARDPIARVALVNEQLGELDYRAQRWARVPRVCASVSTSFAFLLASLAMRDALASDDVDVNGAVMSAINVVTIGLAGASFCIAVHVRSRAMTKGRLLATDKLVERLEQIEAWSPPPLHAMRRDEAG